MTTQTIAAALQGVETALRHRPEAGLHDDGPATAVPIAVTVDVDAF